MSPRARQDTRALFRPSHAVRVAHRTLGVLAVLCIVFIVSPSLLHFEDPSRPSTDLPAVEKEIARFIMGYAERYKLDPALLQAIIQVESNFNPTAVSPKGARGLMQLMPLTAEALQVLDPFDPGENIRAGAAEVRRLLDRFHGDLRLALAAYHAGEGRVLQYLGVPPLKSTQAYVEKVLRIHKAFTEASDAPSTDRPGRLSRHLAQAMLPVR